MTTCEVIVMILCALSVAWIVVRGGQLMEEYPNGFEDDEEVPWAVEVKNE